MNPVATPGYEWQALPWRKLEQHVYRIQKRIFNADLALIDDEGNPRPYLAESLPRLNTDTWRVFPDGRMETTYRLKACLLPSSNTSDSMPKQPATDALPWP